MHRTAKLVLASSLAFATLIPAQSNTVQGLDGRLTVISQMTYYGRRGQAHPNGEIGMAFLNTMCNPGTVNIPWQAAMQPNHPMFGFLVVRMDNDNDRIEQINEWSFCKHAFTSINVNGQCGSCQNPGTGSLMGINCSDTYAPSNNASRTWLGPPEEIDPWLGTWTPVGSYFDIGDPMQPGYPLPADGQRSLSTSIFDSVDNRVTIDEIDLTTANADYYYSLQLIHRGESLTNRGDNLAHRGMNPTWNGSQWSFPNNSASQQYGSVLDRWQGATVHSESNGLDDGRFYVASKVTNLPGGLYHYEYAAHNVDNSRAGATFRIPLAAGVTASNFTFGDIDTDVANDWTVQQVGNEVVFTAPGDNPLEWNTIYNFGFDADRAPGQGAVRFDEARPGAGAPFVDVVAEVPGGVIFADFENFGAGCPGTVSTFNYCFQVNPGGGSLSGNTSLNEVAFLASLNQGDTVVGFDVFTRSTTGGNVSIPAAIYSLGLGGPSSAPIATTTMTVGPNADYYTATFSTPVPTTGVMFMALDLSAGNAVMSEIPSASPAVYYRRSVAGTGTWTVGTVPSSWRVNCGSSTVFLPPELGNVGTPQINSSYDVTVANAQTSAPAILLTGLSDSVYQGTPLPAPLPGAAGCEILAAPENNRFTVTDGSGNANLSFNVPNNGSLAGLVLFHQWAVLDSANNLGIVVSDAGRALVGN